MEVQDGYKNMGKVLAVEMVGTGLLLLSINFGANSYSAFIIYQAETVACILFCLILCLGSISGGHFNPAVTVAVLIKEGRKNLAINLLCTALIILAQIIGATIGCLLALPGLNFGLEHTDLSEYGNATAAIWPGIAVLCPPTDRNLTDVMFHQADCDPFGRGIQAFYGEMLGTAIFVTVILTLKYHKGTGFDILDAQGIAFTLYGMIEFSRGISGSCLNPAVGIVQSVFQYVMFYKNYDKSFMTVSSLYIYTLGPFVGGIIAGFASLALGFLYEKPDEQSEVEEEEKFIEN